jgi:hypothetical protein
VPAPDISKAPNLMKLRREIKDETRSIFHRQRQLAGLELIIKENLLVASAREISPA